MDEELVFIAQRRRTWQVVNVCIAGAAVLLVLGFAALVEPLEQAGGGVLVPLSFAVLLLGAALWLVSLIFRVTASVAAGTAPPPGFEAVSAWAGGLFLAWTALGNAAVLGFGMAILRSGYPATWAGWAAVALGTLMLVQLVVTGDAIPGLYHLAPAVIGVTLLLD